MRLPRVLCGFCKGDTLPQKSEQKPLHAARIEDYALIGDCETAALICKDGSLDWLCWPNFSSGACFAALLGTADNGYFKIKPAATETITGEDWEYKKSTLIVEKTWTTQHGEVLVSDFMPPRGKHSDVVRIVQGKRGTVRMRMELALRFDYGRTIPWVQHAGNHLRAIAGPQLVVLRTEAPLHGEGLTTASDFDIHEGESICFVLSYGSSLEDDPATFDAFEALRDTETFWLDWTAKRQFHSDWDECVERSLITLKALTYRPTGGLVAAPTTSLPEKIGGIRNWDYRFCWLRDTAFTLLTLLYQGYTEEALAWRGWLLRAIAGSAEQIQSLYGLAGERQLTEWQADWLPGYENSSPVNIGNKAADQLQLDVFGEVITALARTPTDDDDMFDPLVRSLVINMLNHLESIWQQPDRGIWETRGEPQHFVHSKVMAWVAFARAIESYEENGDHADPEVAKHMERWRAVRDAIHHDVCTNGFNKDLNSFTQAYGSTRLDAATLRIALVGFLPATDPRILGTLQAIETQLRIDDLVRRYKTDDGSDSLPPGEGAFLACSFWLVAVMYLSGRKDEARETYTRLLKLRNPLGLIAEEYDHVAQRQVGNFPQAFTHLTMAHAAVILSGGKGPWSTWENAPEDC